MAKTISVLGGHRMTGVLLHALVSMGHHAMVGNKPIQPVYSGKQFARIDASDFKPPVNGYQKKQRKRKAMRKAK